MLYSFAPAKPPKLSQTPDQRGLSLLEVLVGLLVFTLVFIPAYTLYVQSRGAALRSKLALVSTLAAQEEAEDLRLLARVAGTSVKDFAHDWTPVGQSKHVLARLSGQSEKYRGLALTTQPETPAGFDYPSVYERIWTRLEVQESADGFVYPAVIHVLWQEHGEKFTDADLKKREGFSRFEFYLIRPLQGI